MEKPSALEQIRGRQGRITALLGQLVIELAPDKALIRETLEDLLAFVPYDTPKQFLDPKVFPYGPAHFDKQTAAEDAKAPFFTESYLYTLLGKEDARLLRSRFRVFLNAIGFSDDEIGDLL